EENIDIIFSGAGLALDLPKYLTKDTKTKLAPIVSSARATKIIFEKWKNSYGYIPDAIVVEGPLAGGHLGFSYDQLNQKEFQLENLVSDILEIIKPYEKDTNRKIPLIAAGGIYTGKDIFNFLQMGASAVQMGTRFVATHECDASLEFKEQYINALPEDIDIIKSPVGMPGRAIINPYLKKMNEGEKKPVKCQYHCIKTCNYKETDYCIANALVQAQLGNLKDGFAFSGSNAFKVDKIVSVKEVFDAIKKEYNDHISLLNKSNKNKIIQHSEKPKPLLIPSFKSEKSSKSLG
ncbi:NAD(P)H-dependent flavin oxidoreductase, partial [candidate division KSB1 bacterium]